MANANPKDEAIYARRNILHCKAVGALENAKAALKKLRAQKRPPRWLVRALESIVTRAKPVADEMAAHRDEVRDTSPPWFDTCQTLDCQAWPTWRVVDAAGRVVRGSYNCDEHRPQEQPRVDGERYEHRQPLARGADPKPLRPADHDATETRGVKDR